MDGVKDASREELLRLLALERERRFTAERTAEEEKQAALQLLLLFQEKAEPLSLQPELTRSHSISSSIISSPIPRAFSQDFYEAVLHELPVDLQDTLAGLQQGNSSGKAPGIYYLVGTIAMSHLLQRAALVLLKLVLPSNKVTTVNYHSSFEKIMLMEAGVWKVVKEGKLY